MSSAPDPQLVSVIVPCFDTAPYLDECLASLVDQSHTEIEIIAIDDGSTDGTPGMLDEWQRRDDRVQVVHQRNRGLGAARNVGLDMAVGRYITFVDSDDRLPVDALARMVTTIERTGSDFVTGVAERFDGERTWRTGLYRGGFEADIDRTHVSEDPNLLADHIICSKLFRRSFWNEHGFAFPEGTLFEDIEIATRAHCLARSVDILATPTYSWRSRPDGDLSITQARTRPGSVSDRFGALTRADHFIRDHASEDLWRHHGLKVLSTDIPLYLREIESADDRYAGEYVASAGDFLRSASPAAVAEQGFLRTRLAAMLVAGDVRSVRAMATVMGKRSARALPRQLAAIRFLSWRDRAWLVGVAISVAWRRIRHRSPASTTTG
jgi:CDP-glycerol glycerophosphotransferase